MPYIQLYNVQNQVYFVFFFSYFSKDKKTEYRVFAKYYINYINMDYINTQ